MTTLDELYVKAWSSWDDPEALASVGRELGDRNRLPRAREVLSRALELDPGNLECWECLSYAFFRDFRDEEGRRVLRDGIEATGSDRLRMTLSHFVFDEEERARLREAVAGSDDPVVQGSLLAGGFVRPVDAETLERLRAFCGEHPEEEELRDILLWTLFGARRAGVLDEAAFREEALPLAASLVAAKPDSAGPHAHRLMALGILEDWNGILAATEEGLARFPDEETMMHLRGRAFREKGDLDRAAHWFCRAIGAKPSFVGARVDLGKLYERMEKLGLAEEVFREIPAANPTYPARSLSLALFLHRRGRTEEAERHFLESWPGLPPWMQEGLKKDPDAAALLQRPAVKEALGTTEV